MLSLQFTVLFAALMKWGLDARFDKQQWLDIMVITNGTDWLHFTILLYVIKF